MPTLVIDIETKSGNHSIAAVAEMASRCQREDGREPSKFAACSPYLSEVACICTKDANGSGREDGMVADGNWNEADLLDWFNGTVSDQKITRLVTFAGRWFDLPTLVSRMIANRVRPTPLLMRAIREPRYKPDAHIDLIEVLTQGGASRKPSLREVCIGWGIDDPKAGCNGDDVSGMIARGEFSKVKEYCHGDVRAATAVYAMCREAGLV